MGAVGGTGAVVGVCEAEAFGAPSTRCDDGAGAALVVAMADGAAEVSAVGDVTLGLDETLAEGGVAALFADTTSEVFGWSVVSVAWLVDDGWSAEGERIFNTTATVPIEKIPAMAATISATRVWVGARSTAATRALASEPAERLPIVLCCG